MRSFLRNSVEHSSNLVFADAKGCDIRQFQAPGAGKCRTFIKFRASCLPDRARDIEQITCRVSFRGFFGGFGALGEGRITTVCCDGACLAGASFQAFLDGSAQVSAPWERGESGRYAAMGRAFRGASCQAFLGGSAQVLGGFPTSLEKWCPSRVLSSSSNVRRDGRDSSGALWAALGLPLGLVGKKHPSV